MMSGTIYKRWLLTPLFPLKILHPKFLLNHYHRSKLERVLCVHADESDDQRFVGPRHLWQDSKEIQGLRVIQHKLPGAFG